jgi:hypothetical protein
MTSLRIIVVPLNRLTLVVRHVDIIASPQPQQHQQHQQHQQSPSISHLKTHVISLLSARFLAAETASAALCAATLRPDTILFSLSSSPAVTLADSTPLASLSSAESLLLSFSPSVDTAAFVARFTSPDHVPPLEAIPAADRGRRPPVEAVSRVAAPAGAAAGAAGAAVASRSGTKSNATTTAATSGSYTIDATCAYCFAQTSVGVFQDAVTCSHCSKRNIAVSTIVASAECQCGAQTVRRAGGDALKCAKCAYSTREAKCTRCGVRFVYPAVWPSATLPCANNCGAKLSVAEATVLPERVVARTLLRELAPARSARLCGGATSRRRPTPRGCACRRTATPMRDAWPRWTSVCRAISTMPRCAAYFCWPSRPPTRSAFAARFVAAVASGRLSVVEHGRAPADVGGVWPLQRRAAHRRRRAVRAGQRRRFFRRVARQLARQCAQQRRARALAPRRAGRGRRTRAV